MKTRLMLATVLAVVGGMLIPATLPAQTDHEPGVVISLASIQEQLDDIGYLLESSGFGQFKFMINMQAKEFLKGVDMERPAGALLFFSDEGMAPDVVGFVPVSNVDDLIGVISEYTDINDGEDGMMSLGMDNGNELFLKESGGYVFVSNKSENLVDLPADPAELIGDLPSQYNVALRLFGDRIPEGTRQFIMDQIRDGMESQLDAMGEDDLAELQRTNIELQMQQLGSFIEDTDQAEVGVGIDKDSNSIRFDLRLVGKPDSKFARQVEAAREHKTRFGGFLMPDSAFHGISHSIVSKEDLPMLEQMLDELAQSITQKLDEDDEMSGEERDAVSSLVTAVIDTVRSTAQGGAIDMGIVAKIDGTEVNVGMALQTADPGTLEAEIKNIVPMVQERADGKLEVNLDAFELVGATFHEFKVAIPESEEEARAVFGEHLIINVGFGSDVTYLGVGGGSADLIKQAMEPASVSDEPLPMTEFNLFLAPILELVAAVQDDQTVTKMAEKLREVGRDRIRVSGKAIDNGIVTRLEIQDGFLQLIQIAAAQMGAGPPRDF